MDKIPFVNPAVAPPTLLIARYREVGVIACASCLGNQSVVLNIANRDFEFYSLGFILGNGSTAGTRKPYLSVRGNGVTLFEIGGDSIGSAADEVTQYSFVAGVYGNNRQVTITGHQIIGIPMLVIPASYEVELNVDGGLAEDQLAGVVLTGRYC